MEELYTLKIWIYLDAWSDGLFSKIFSGLKDWETLEDECIEYVNVLHLKLLLSIVLSVPSIPGSIITVTKNSNVEFGNNFLASSMTASNKNT